jgi:DNA excision repair protein ERCC-2
LKSELKIAVRSLVQHMLRSGDLELEFMGSSRAIEAIRAHRKIQKSRPENYVPEVPVSFHIETEQFILTVSGRIDGVYHNTSTPGTDGVIIEEIKTTRRNLEHYQQQEDPQHWGQAKSYAYLYAIENSLDAIEIQVTYHRLDTGETREFKRRFLTSELEEFFQDLVARYLKWARTLSNWCQQRDQSIGRMEFPFAVYRPGQRQMSVEIYRTIRNSGQLVVQAATGIGKTMAAVFPAVKAIAEGLNQKVFYLTARTTGRTVAEKALDVLRKRGLKIKSLTLTAKDKICFNPERNCTADECTYARGHYDRINQALAHMFQQDAFNRDAIEQVAQNHRVCPFEFSLELSLWADFIICDYNYAFDPRVYLRRFFLEESEAYTFLIDEAHNLVDRAREMFSAEIFKQPFLDVRRAIKPELPQIYKSMGQINTWMLSALKKCQESGGPRSERHPPENLYPLLRTFLRLTERWLSLNIKTPFREKLLELYFTVSGFTRIAEQYDDTYATFFEPLKKDLKLKLFCIDPSIQLNEALKRCKAAVFFSATMTPAAYFKNIFGCEAFAKNLVLPSPFPAENLGLFIAGSPSTLYRQRDRTAPQITQSLLTFVKHKKGNYLLFFPSYEYMMMIYELFASESPENDTMVQKPYMAEFERDAFLARFARHNPQTLVGFAVMGGIFGEGIDLLGDRLCGAAIVGVGLPGITPERELIREYFTNTIGTGFEYAYLYPGINRVLQAAGRVIRSEDEHGVVLLIGRRYGTVRYRSLLPNEWRPVTVRNEEQLKQELERFWNE